MNSGPSSYLALQSAARKVLPKAVGVSVVDPRVGRRPVLAEEAPAIARARDVRVREFSGGRAAARDAITGLGQKARPIPMGPDRAPIWPEGLTGSITHDDRACLAIAATRDLFAALGADLEPDEELPPELIAEICTPSERDWLAKQPFAQQGRIARMIFSAKECTYKCQYGLSGDMLEFHDLEIRFADGLSRFGARFLRSALPFVAGSVLQGHCLMVSGHILTLMTLSSQHGAIAVKPDPIGANPPMQAKAHSWM